jgi:hypothetical protein
VGLHAKKKEERRQKRNYDQEGTRRKWREMEVDKGEERDRVAVAKMKT